MGSICPCLRAVVKQQKPQPYDMHETFEISENISDISSKRNGFEMLNQEPELSSNLKISQNTGLNDQQGSQNTLVQQLPKQKSQPKMDPPVTQQLIQIATVPVIQPQQPVVPPKKVNRYKKNVNLDDYRFINLTSELKVKKLNTLNSQQFNINNCKDSEFYIFDITANLYVDKCHDCFIYCAPCQSTIFIRDCTNITMVGATKQFRVRDCKDCSISLYCNSQPVIQSSSNMQFSNFGTIGYVQLYDQFIKTKMSVFNNHWSQIHDFTKGEQLNYSLVMNKQFQCEWKKGIEQAGLTYVSPMIPLTMNELQQQYQLAFLFNPTSEQQQQLVQNLVSTHFISLKTYKGRIPEQVYNHLKQQYSEITQNNFICLKIRSKSQTSIHKNFKIIEDENGKFESLIFPSFKDQH